MYSEESSRAWNSSADCRDDFFDEVAIQALQFAFMLRIHLGQNFFRLFTVLHDGDKGVIGDFTGKG
jgi:hypothetical protein